MEVEEMEVEEMDNDKEILIMSPLTGKAVPLDQVPDPVFSGKVMENIGWAVIGNLHILFAAAIGGSWAKERAGGAFAAVSLSSQSDISLLIL